MKRLLLILLLLPFGLNGQIRSVKVNVLGGAFGSIGVSFEHVKKKQYAWQFSLTYRPKFDGPSLLFNKQEPGWNTEEAKTAVYGGQISRRWYTNKAKKNPAKPYFALYGQSQFWQGELRQSFDGQQFEIDGTYSTFTFGLQFGTNWIFDDKFCIDFTFVGFGISANQIKAHGIASQSGYAGFWEENLSQIPVVGSHLLLEGTDGAYSVNAGYVGINVHTALRLGFLF
ncbi:MAG: DUF3575 domain-containing protein [Cryomorphaceae bacterium]|nr:DUF3575 domain-containing protein [Cryomorphaceae bacterium]